MFQILKTGTSLIYIYAVVNSIFGVLHSWLVVDIHQNKMKIITYGCLKVKKMSHLIYFLTVPPTA